VLVLCIHGGAERNIFDEREHTKVLIFWKGLTSCTAPQPISTFVQPLHVVADERAEKVEAAALEEAAYEADEERQVLEQENKKKKRQGVSAVEEHD